MNERFSAIFENGVLRPLEPIALGESEVVSVSIDRMDGNGRGFDDANQSFVALDGDSQISWEQVQTVTSKLPGSLADDFGRERDERF